MIKRALQHNMFVLIEAFNKEELEQICSLFLDFMVLGFLNVWG
ncbi:MAG: hypothetical protein Ct9H300mP6_11970 [Gammaproteobacteria bacterium]|nr:MAG: hypothetical protein Ct9H300mP6_11970 [Gammaproteobacteria bacterium]